MTWQSFFSTKCNFLHTTTGEMQAFKSLSNPDWGTSCHYNIYSIEGAAESCFQHLEGTLLLDENVSRCDAKQWSAKENYKSNSCEFHLVASRRMCIWQLPSVRRCLHSRKVNGDGGENQCGCKQRNSRVMCSLGQATPKMSSQGNAEPRRNSVAVFTSLSGGPRCLFRNLTPRPPIKTPDGKHS